MNEAQQKHREMHKAKGNSANSCSIILERRGRTVAQHKGFDQVLTCHIITHPPLSYPPHINVASEPGWRKLRQTYLPWMRVLRAHREIQCHDSVPMWLIIRSDLGIIRNYSFLNLANYIEMSCWIISNVGG